MKLPAVPETVPKSSLDEAVERIQESLRGRERICVWGDFDVDGLTATTVLVSTLRDLGGDVSYHIPNRAAEGHGGIFIDAYSAVPHRIENFRDHVHLTPAGNEAVAAAIFFGLVESPVFVERLAGSGALLGGRPEDLATGAAQEE